MNRSTAYFESLCIECSYDKGRYLVRLYPDAIDTTLHPDKLPPYHGSLVISTDSREGHATGAFGRITHQNINDMEAFLKTKQVLLCHWERHQADGTIKRVSRKIK
ncbi:MAG: hypothetical protein KGZ88_11755 [Methylomicrobium sp.]|nr:hypothetical protein [Methylomicrobium sp.]